MTSTWSRLFLLLALFASLASCQGPTPQLTEVDSAPPRPGEDFVFVFLEVGEAAGELTPEQVREASLGHRANIKRLGQDRILLLAGPFGEPRLEPAHRGIFIFDVESMEEARELTSTDPAVQVGAFSMTASPWRSPSDLREVHELELARQESGEAFVGRAYVMGIGFPADAAQQALASLNEERKIPFMGEFGGERAGEVLFVLITDSVNEARAWLTDAPGGVDVDWNLSSWYATDNLMRMLD